MTNTLFIPFAPLHYYQRWIKVIMSKVEVLTEAITQEILGFLMIDNNLELDEAMNLLYNSDLFDKLQDTETGLYLEGSAYVYELLKDELKQV